MPKRHGATGSNSERPRRMRALLKKHMSTLQVWCLRSVELAAGAVRILRRMLMSLLNKPFTIEQDDPKDLSDVVQKSEPYYFDYGEYEDLWKAKSLCRGCRELERQLVIKVIRGIVHDESRKIEITNRLMEAVKTSNVLRLRRHPNIVPVYGFVTNMGNFPSPVTPYYANGDALHYLAKEPHANKLQIITDIANALNFMHTYSDTPVIHGNLKASNVLIEDDGRALISDIGIYTVVSQSEFTSANIAGSCRWSAPEVLDPPEEDEEKPISSVLTAQTDVYAFGMTVLEIYTGTKPFSNRRHDPTVIFDVIKGIRPKRPESAELTDELWALMCECWKQNPKERPSMRNVHERLLDLQPASKY